MSRLASTFTILATLSAGILIGSFVTHGVRGQESAKIDTSDATPLKVPQPKQLSTDFTRIAKEVGPAVVNINTITLPHERQGRRNPHQRQFQQQQPPDDDNNDDDDQDDGQGNFQDFFNRFFGGQGQMPDESGQERESLGSGFIVDPRGYILTNNHVIDKADRIFVRLSTDPDGGNIQARPAKVIGVDKDTDIAVIKIETNEPLPTVKIGNSEGAEVGDWVIAIGSPFTLSQTVTAGIVSARNRTIDPGQRGQFQHFIQTDAAINPGNSGGPLLDMAGEVIGINTAILSETNAYAGVGFSLPSNTVAQVYNQLIGPEHRVARGSIGIMFDSVENPAIARVYGNGTGVTISSVVAGSPADQAGLKVGDTITIVDGKKVTKGAELVADIASRKPGAKVQLGFVRNGKQQETSVTIADRAKLFAARLNEDDNGNDESTPKQSKFGITVRKLTPEMAERLDMPAGKGVIVQDVKPGSFAEDVNLNRGDVILEINKQPVNSEEDFARVESSLKSGQDVVFLVRPRGSSRQDGTIFLPGTLP